MADFLLADGVDISLRSISNPTWLILAVAALVAGLTGLALRDAAPPPPPSPEPEYPAKHREDGPTRPMRPQPQALLVEDLAVSARDERGRPVWEFIDPQGGGHR